MTIEIMEFQESQYKVIVGIGRVCLYIRAGQQPDTSANVTPTPVHSVARNGGSNSTGGSNGYFYVSQH